MDKVHVFYYYAYICLYYYFFFVLNVILVHQVKLTEKEKCCFAIYLFVCLTYF